MTTYLVPPLCLVIGAAPLRLKAFVVSTLESISAFSGAVAVVKGPNPGKERRTVSAGARFIPSDFTLCQGGLNLQPIV
jgi:hypothetical protein